MNAYKERFLAPKFENIPDGLKTLPWAAWITPYSVQLSGMPIK
jgi:hypothetical protein